MIPSTSPIVSMRRKGTYDDPYVPITETFTVRDGRVILTEIPDQFTHVTSSGYTEVYKNNPTATQFYVDYNLGIVYFNASKNNTSLPFTYKGTGAVYFPAERIWTETSGLNVTETLSDMITAGNDAIQSLNDVNAVIDAANTKITQTETARQNAITATTNANTATTQANTARDSANTAASTATSATTSANTATTNANAAKANADTAATGANTAATNANAATTNANTAVNNLLHLGTYSAAITYNPKNMVTYNNEIFICLVQSINVTPVEGVKWRRMLTVADIVTNAQTATTNANTATTNANNAATYATTQGDYAKSKGDEALSVSTAFNTAESGRVTAESNRVTAETGRASAEATRVTQETARVNTEGDASKGRVKAENNRVTAESNRVIAENSRVSAETTRGTNETTRQSQETTRQSQETTRQSQETTRQTNTTTAINNINDTNTQLYVWETYNFSKTYKPLNKVTYNGSSYVCIAECIGVLPTDTSKFLLIAQRGLDGQGAVDSVNSQTGAVVLTATDVGAETPSGAQTKANQAETNAKAYADTKVAALVDSSPATLDTLNELAAALGDDPNFATTISTQIGNKVDKVAGKQLSTEDYTTTEKTKLAGIQDGANNYSHPANHPASMVTGLATVATSGSFNDLNDKPTPFDPGTLATVATTGEYSDLLNPPTIPSKTSDLTNDSGFGVGDGINVETLYADKTLLATDATYQYLNTSSNRYVNLPSNATIGKRFYIYNTCDYTSSLFFTIQGTISMDTVRPGDIKGYIYNETAWVPCIPGTGDNTNPSQNVGFGYGSSAYSRGSAFGYGSRGYVDGVCVGNSAYGYSYGVGVGYYAKGNSNGVAIGYNSNTNSKNYAVAKGYYSKAERWNEEVKSSDGASTTKYSYSTLAWHGQTTNATQTELFLGGTSNQRCTVLASSAFGFSLYCTALDNVSGKAKRWKLEGLIKRDASNNTALVGSVTKTVITQSDSGGTGTDTWDIVAEADDTNEALVLKFTGEAGKTIRVIARGEIEEVKF